MPYFISDKNLESGDVVEVSGEEAKHILLAQRIKKGEKIKLQGPNGKRFLVEVLSVSRNQLSVKVLEGVPLPLEPKEKITLFQSFVSEKALDFILQKSTELGVVKIVLFNSENTATKITHGVVLKKIERWNKIIKEAVKQCERVSFPTLEFIADRHLLVEKIKSLDSVLLADVNGNKLADQKLKNIGIIIGPEGGFKEKEILFFKNLSNIKTVSLSPNILRAETAAVAALAIIQNQLQ